MVCERTDGAQGCVPTACIHCRAAYSPVQQDTEFYVGESNAE